MQMAKFPLTPMGVLAPGSANARPSAQPFPTFSGERVCRVTFKHLPQPLISHIQSFGTLGEVLKMTPFSAHSVGGKGGPRIVLFVGVLLFSLVRSPIFEFTPLVPPNM